MRLIYSCIVFSCVLAALHSLTWLLESDFSQYFSITYSISSVTNDSTHGQEEQHNDQPVLKMKSPFDAHLGARYANGSLGLIVDPSPNRLVPPYDIAHSNNKSACGVGIEGQGGRQVLNKVRKGVIAYQQSRNNSRTTKECSRPRLLCMVYTYEQGHANVHAIACTWGRQCDGFIALSNFTNDSIGAADLLHHGPEAYGNMWQKVRSMWAYAYDHYREDYDYFYICGDDVYVAVENMRTYLEGKQIERLLNGHLDVFTKLNRNATQWKTRRPRPLLLGMPMNLRMEIFPAGGCGYVLNRAALDLLVEVVLEEFSPNATDSREDVFVGSGLWRHGVVTSDSRDDKGAFRFGGTADSIFHFNGIASPVGPRLMKRRYGVEMYKGMKGASSETISFHIKGTNVPETMLRYHTLLQGYCDIL